MRSLLVPCLIALAAVLVFAWREQQGTTFADRLDMSSTDASPLSRDPVSQLDGASPAEPQSLGSARESVPSQSGEVVAVAPSLPASNYGRIGGYVFASDGAPAVGAGVEIAGSRHRTTTDGKGAFGIEDVAPGTRRLVASSFGLAARMTVELAPSQELTGVELRFNTGGWIEGRLLDAEGAAAVNRMILASPDDSGDRSIRTDANGSFRQGPLKAGDYEVMGLLTGDFETTELDTVLQGLVSVPAEVVDGETTNVLLQPDVGPRPHLAGVVMKDGKPVAKSLVFTVREARSFLAGPRSGLTDSEGRFDIELAGAGRHVVLVYEPNSVTVSLRTFFDVPNTGLVDVVLDHPSGSIVLEFEDGARVGVVARLLRLDAPIGFSALRQKRSLATSSVEEPRFDHLAAGRYRLTASSPKLASAPIEITLAENEVQRVPIALELGGTIRIDFRANPNPPEFAHLLVIDAEGRPGARPGYHEKGGGAWESPVLRPGRWSVVCAASGERAGASTWLTVEGKSQAKGDLTLQRGARVTVQARKGGQPEPASFRLFDSEGREVTQLHVPRNGAELVSTRSDEGHFGPLVPGRYRVVAKAEGGGTSETHVDLEEGDQKRLTIECDAVK